MLLVLGLLAMAAGGLKLRDRIRSRMGTTPFSLAEVALGAVAGLLAATMPDPTTFHSVVAGLTVLAMLVAGIHQARLAAAFQHRRDLSESFRLQRFVGTPDGASAAQNAESPGGDRPRPALKGLQELAAQADKTAVRPGSAGGRPRRTSHGTTKRKP